MRVIVCNIGVYPTPPLIPMCHHFGARLNLTPIAHVDDEQKYGGKTAQYKDWDYLAVMKPRLISTPGLLDCPSSERRHRPEFLANLLERAFSIGGASAGERPHYSPRTALNTAHRQNAKQSFSYSALTGNLISFSQYVTVQHGDARNLYTEGIL